MASPNLSERAHRPESPNCSSGTGRHDIKLGIVADLLSYNTRFLRQPISFEDQGAPAPGQTVRGRGNAPRCRGPRKPDLVSTTKGARLGSTPAHATPHCFGISN